MNTILYRCEEEHGYHKTPICPVCHKKCSIACHRTILKLTLNPILRLFGWQIVSVFNDEDDSFIKFMLMKVKQ
jgi:hypothetical protein